MTFPVVIPAAGYGTRSLPASKAIPKEMCTIFDRPTIQYIVDEAVAAGLRDVIFVTSRGKSAVEDHFDINFELEAILERGGKKELLKDIQDLSRKIRIHSVRQKSMNGLGDAVLQAKPLVASSHFAVALGDDLVEAGTPGLKQLIQVYEKIQTQKPEAGVVMLMDVPESETHKYGICEMDPKTGQISRCIEKPKLGTTSSRLAIVGRYFLPKKIFAHLENSKPGAINEIQLTDGLQALASEGLLYGHILQGLRFDAGDRIGFLRASLYYGLKSPLKKEVAALIQEMAGK